MGDARGREREAVAQKHPSDFADLRAKRHSHADFARAPGAERDMHGSEDGQEDGSVHGLESLALCLRWRHSGNITLT